MAFQAVLIPPRGHVPHLLHRVTHPGTAEPFGCKAAAPAKHISALSLQLSSVPAPLPQGPGCQLPPQVSPSPAPKLPKRMWRAQGGSIPCPRTGLEDPTPVSDCSTEQGAGTGTPGAPPVPPRSPPQAPSRQHPRSPAISAGMCGASLHPPSLGHRLLQRHSHWPGLRTDQRGRPALAASAKPAVPVILPARGAAAQGSGRQSSLGWPRSGFIFPLLCK